MDVADPSLPLGSKGLFTTLPQRWLQGQHTGTQWRCGASPRKPPHLHAHKLNQHGETSTHTHPQLYRFLQPNTRHSRRACQPLFADLPPLSSCGTWWATVRYGKMNRVGLGPDPAKGLFLETHIPGGDRHVHGQESVRLAVHTGQSPAPHHSLSLQHCAHDKPEEQCMEQPQGGRVSTWRPATCAFGGGREGATTSRVQQALLMG